MALLNETLALLDKILVLQGQVDCQIMYQALQYDQLTLFHYLHRLKHTAHIEKTSLFLALRNLAALQCLAMLFLELDHVARPYLDQMTTSLLIHQPFS